jgi:hypothetical protein
MLQDARRAATLIVLAVAGALAGAAPAQAAPTWLPAAPLASAASVPAQTVIDRDGTMLAVWEESTGPGTVLRFSERRVGQPWAPAIDLTPRADGRYDFGARLGIDDAGTATLLWVTLRDDGVDPRSSVVRAATRPRGGSWGAPADLAQADDPQDLSRTQLAVAPGGAATAVWQLYVGGTDYRVVSARRGAAGVWSAPENVSAASVSERVPQVAADDAGRAVVVWIEGDVPITVRASSRDAAGTWDAPVTLNGTPNVGSFNPSVALDAGGTAVAAWQRSTGGSARIETATRPAGGAWGSPEFLTGTGLPTAFQPRVAVAPGGAAAVTWTQSDGSKNRVRAKRRPAGGAWEATAADLSAAGQDASGGAVVTSRDGEVSVVWSRSDGTDWILQAAHAGATGPWGAAVDVASDADQPSNEPVLAVGAHGDVALGWLSPNGIFVAKGVVPPTCTSSAAAVTAGAAVTVDLPCSGTVDTRAIGTGPALGALGPIDQVLGRVPFTASPGPGGADAFTFTGSNAAGTSAPATVNLTVTPQPPAPAGPPPPAPPAPSAKPSAVAFGSLVTLPSAKKCVSRRSLRIRLRVPKGVGVSSAEVRVNGKRVRTVKRARFGVPVDLRGLPKGRVTVSVRVRLADGRTITGTRTYRTCAPRKAKPRR